MDTREARQKIYEIVDNEASEIEAQELDSFLKGNSALKAQFELEKRLRRFLRSNSHDEILPASALDSIRQKLDQVDAEPHVSGSLNSAHKVSSYSNVTNLGSVTEGISRTRRYSLAMAASFFLMIFGGYATVSFFQHKTAFGAFEDAHFSVRSPANNFATEQTTADASSFISERFGVDIDPGALGLSLCGGERIKFDQTEFAHFKFCGSDQEPISIFVGSSSDYGLPEMPSTIIAGKEYFRHSCHGCELMYWRNGEALIIAATAPDKMDNRAISSLITGLSVPEMSPAEPTDSL